MGLYIFYVMWMLLLISINFLHNFKINEVAKSTLRINVKVTESSGIKAVSITVRSKII
jgi:hypothetical protein